MSSDTEDYPTAQVPTVWRGKDGEAIRTNSPVVHPDDMSAAERDMLTTTYNTCGQCQHFEKAHGQAQMEAQKFVTRLVREENWQVKHLASPVNELGICGEHDAGTGGDQTLTGVMHKACDHFTPSRGTLSARRRSTD